MGLWDSITNFVADPFGAGVQAGQDVAAALNGGPDVVQDGSGGAGSDSENDYRIMTGAAPNLSMIPMPPPPGGGGGGGTTMLEIARGIVDAISDRLGKNISLAQVVKFIAKYGWETASSAFGQPPQNLTIVVAAAKASPRRRRGPHLYTVLKRIRTGKRYEKMLTKYAKKAHVGGGHRRQLAKNATIVQFRRKAK